LPVETVRCICEGPIRIDKKESNGFDSERIQILGYAIHLTDKLCKQTEERKIIFLKKKPTSIVEC
jgi:hypothetical protein